MSTSWGRGRGEGRGKRCKSCEERCGESAVSLCRRRRCALDSRSRLGARSPDDANEGGLRASERVKLTPLSSRPSLPPKETGGGGGGRERERRRTAREDGAHTHLSFTLVTPDGPQDDSRLVDLFRHLSVGIFKCDDVLRLRRERETTSGWGWSKGAGARAGARTPGIRRLREAAVASPSTGEGGQRGKEGKIESYLQTGAYNSDTDHATVHWQQRDVIAITCMTTSSQWRSTVYCKVHCSAGLPPPSFEDRMKGWKPSHVRW